MIERESYALGGREISEDSFSNYRRKYSVGYKSNHTWRGKLENIVKAIPDRLAFVQGERRLTWKQFDGRVNRLANALSGLGIKKEDRVGIAGFNSIEWMESYFGISKIGAVPFNINPRAALDELGYVIEDADAVAIIVEDDYAPIIERVTEGIASLKHIIVYGVGKPAQNIHRGALIYEDLLAKYPPTKPELDYKITNEDFCYLMYTSGTTGYPKGVVWDGEQRVKGVEMLIYNVLVPAFERIDNDKIFEFVFSLYPMPLLRVSRPLSRLGLFRWMLFRFFKTIWGSTLMITESRRLLKEGVKYVPVCPLFHASAYMQTFGNIVASATTTVFLPTPYPFNARELLEVMEKEKVNGIMINGDAFAMLILDELKKVRAEGRKYDLSTWRAIISSGVRWFPRVKKELCELLPQVVIMDVYGCTEFGIAYSSAAVLEDKETPLAGATLPARGGLYPLQSPFRVVNPETGGDVKPGMGEMGEFAAGGYVALGYWKCPEKTRSSFRVIEGKRYFFTGDDGYVDKELRFSFVGRGKEVITIGGEKVYAEEVKEVIKSHPKVRDAAVVGVPDRELGEALAAIVELEKGEDLTEEEIAGHCRQSLPAHKVPRYVMFVVSLPREVTGKMEKRVLKEFAEGRLGPRS